jgi:hypothetical protein
MTIDSGTVMARCLVGCCWLSSLDFSLNGLKLGRSVARWHIFKPKLPLWVNFKCLAMKYAGKVKGHFVYFPPIWYILWPFGTFCGHFGNFSRFGIFTKKHLATLLGRSWDQLPTRCLYISLYRFTNLRS